ncbi:MAG: hypothetical protein MPJ50_01940 [Pirellulales bacterium]|nr:hypothetical protein [Pirellulales bacterium]
MFSAHVILFERGDIWRRALRICDAELGDEAPWRDVIETRSLAECRQELLAAHASVLGLEFTPRDAVGVVELLVEIKQRTPLALAVVLVTPDNLPFAKWKLLQAGAKHVITSRRRMGEFAVIARRHLTKMQRLTVQADAELPWEERIRAELPL